MTALIETAPAKLNLALHVRGRMADRRHRIETIFAFCEDGDVLSANPSNLLSLAIKGPFAPSLEADDNLVLQAAHMLRSAAHVAGGAALTLDKRLPVASGIGGGSADAAAALRLLTRLWHLQLPECARIARALGADVPSCVLSRSARGTGVGDELEPVRLGLAGTPVLLVNPRIELATGKVFARWDGVDRGPLGDWRKGRSDLEAPAISLVPQIADVLRWLRAQSGTDFVRMSGSGATCFALFDTIEACDAAASVVPSDWWHLATRLR